MKTSARKTLFLIFAAFFLITAPLVVLYAEGYRLDWNRKSVVKTGALYLEARPAPVEMYLNQKLRKKTLPLFPGVYTGNLIPKSHLVEIKKEGYFPWRKNLRVSPKLVTEAKNIVLFPQNAKVLRITSNIENFYFAPSKNYIAIVEKSIVPQVNLYSTKLGREFLVFKGSATSSDYKVAEARWNYDSSRFAFRIERDRDKKWFILDIENGQPENVKTRDLFEELQGLVIHQLEWDPNDQNLIFITIDDLMGTRVLFSYNLQSEKLSRPLAHDVRDYLVLARKIIYVSETLRTVHSLDLATSSLQQELYNPLFRFNSQQIKFIQQPFENRVLAMLMGNEANLVRNTNSAMTLEKIPGQVKNLIPDGDAKKLMVVRGASIDLYWLKDIHVQPFRDAEDRVTILHVDSPILDAVWLSKNNEHIIFSDEDSIKVAELDTRDEQNVHEIAKYPHAKKLYYEEKESNLYFLSYNALYELALK